MKPPPEPPKPEPPPKVEPPKPKPVKKAEPPKKIEKPKPVQKPTEVVAKPVPAPVKPQVAENPQGNNKPAGPIAKPSPPSPPTPPAPPPPKPVDISKLGALAAMSGIKLDARSTKAPPAINIAQVSQNTTTGAEVGMNSITSELKNQATQASQGNASGPIKTKGSGSVGSSYNTEGLGGGTGKRGVKGAVVGTPKLAAAQNGKTEGLSRDQVLKAMQPYLGKVQSCYERSMLSDPNLSGVIDFEWVISAGGSVNSVNIKKNSVAGGEQLGECVSGVIKSIRFPSASNGEDTTPNISFPFGRL